MLNQKQEELLSLVKEKDEIEKEISDLTIAISDLNKKGNKNSLTPKITNKIFRIR